MPLSNEDKQRIHEEEQYRLQVREELRRSTQSSNTRSHLGLGVLAIPIVGTLVYFAWNMVVSIRLH